MSKTTQIEFARLIETYYRHHHGALNLSHPSFRNDGFVTTATMVGPGGAVEIRCGPAEYNAEIFVQTQKGQKRWSLADLLSIESVVNWVSTNRPDLSGKPRLEAEVDYVYRLLVDGMRGVGDLRWVYNP